MGGCPFAAHKGAAGNVTTKDVVFLRQEIGVESGGNLETYRARARAATTA